MSAIMRIRFVYGRLKSVGLLIKINFPQVSKNLKTGNFVGKSDERLMVLVKKTLTKWGCTWHENSDQITQILTSLTTKNLI